MRKLLEESWVPADEAERWDGEAQKLVPIGDGLGGDEARGGATDGVFEEVSGFEIGVGVDGVVEGSVLHPFQANFH